jgi:hypothetical protein
MSTSGSELGALTGAEIFSALDHRRKRAPARERDFLGAGTSAVFLRDLVLPGSADVPGTSRAVPSMTSIAAKNSPSSI